MGVVLADVDGRGGVIMVLGKVRNQRGAGSIGCLFMVVVVAAAMYAGFQFGIPRLRHSSFESRITETLNGNPQRLSDAEVQKQIIQIASDFDIALTPDQVKVDTSNGLLKIDVRYEKLIDLKFWQKTVPFELRREPAPQ
jgi:hypothetical protein